MERKEGIVALELAKEKWSSEVGTITVGATKEEGGTRGSKVTVGGHKSLPFLHFEGDMPNRPVIAMEVWDTAPNDWPEAMMAPLADVVGSPADWAKKCVSEFGADMVCLRLQNANTEWGNVSPDEAAASVKQVLEAVEVPLIVLGPGQDDRDNEVLPRCSEIARGENCLFGMATQDNYKTLTAACLADGHGIIALSPIDINIAKQLNILISDMGFDLGRVVIYPTTGGLGYGIEYAYSIMERGRLAALGGDKLLARPVLAVVGAESWRAKEAKASEQDFPQWGTADERGPIWEAITATAVLQGGADILLMRHPKAVASVRKTIDALMKKD